MNKNRFIAFRNWLNEGTVEDRTILYPGGFKPMHLGHISIIEKYNALPYVKNIKVLIGSSTRDGITQEDSYNIAKILLKDMPKVEVLRSVYPSPLTTAYEFVKSAPKGIYSLAGSEKGEDFKRVEKFIRLFNEGGSLYDSLPEGVQVKETIINYTPLNYSGRTDEYEGSPVSGSILRNDVIAIKQADPDSEEYNELLNNFISNYRGISRNKVDEILDILLDIIKVPDSELVESVDHFEYDILNESPDGIRKSAMCASVHKCPHYEDLNYFDASPFLTFMYHKDTLYSDWEVTHDDIERSNHLEKIWRELKYRGRLWPKYKIISFWDYPSPDKLDKIINDLNSEWKKYQIDKNWFIDLDFKAYSNEKEIDFDFPTSKIMTIEEYSKFYYDNKKLFESSTSKKTLNTHMKHIEELSYNGAESLNWIYETYTKLYSKLKSNTSKDDITISVKIDGAPAVMAWSKFGDFKKPGVGTKLLFSKTPIACFSNEDIDSHYGDKPGLASILKETLKYVSKIGIPKGEIWQGDLLFDSTIKKSETIDNKKLITFKPNTIKYVVDENTELGKLIKLADIGVVWHTRYTGKDIKSLKSSYDINTDKELKQTKGIFMMDPYIRSYAGIINFTAEESELVERLLKSFKSSMDDLLTDDMYNNIIDNKNFILLFDKFQNSLIRENKQINLKTFVLDFTDYIKTQAKTSKSYEDLRKFLIGHKQTLLNILKTLNIVVNLKNIFLQKLNKVAIFDAYVEFKDLSSKQISQEGYAVSDKFGNVIKLVDRKEFAFLNFSSDVLKGWEKNK